MHGLNLHLQRKMFIIILGYVAHYLQFFLIGTMDTHGVMYIHQYQGYHANEIINFVDVSVKYCFTAYFYGVSKFSVGKRQLKVEL